MKKKYGFLAVILAASAFAGFGCGDNVRYENYDDANLYKTGAVKLAADTVTTVKVEWLDGSVELIQSATNEILVSEEEGVETEAERMRYYLDGNTLKINYCKSGFKGTIAKEHKNLQLSLPQGVMLDIESKNASVTALGEVKLAALSIESVSGNFTAESLVCAETAETEIKMTSGRVTIGELFCGSLSAETVSGNFSVDRLSVVDLEMDTTSGDVSLGFYKGLMGEIESSSGDISLTLQGNLTASIAFESLSGGIEIAAGKAQIKENNRYYINGGTASSSACNLEISTFSGNLYIR